MSIYNRLYRARIAPSSSDWREAIRNGVDVVDAGDLWSESFAADAFLPALKPTPVWLSHEDKPVGHVVARTTHGGWHVADFVLDHSRPLSAAALDLLKIGTLVSLGARSLRHDKLLARDGIMRHTIARFDELSILRPGETPAYRGAQIIGIFEMPPARHSQPVLSRELQPGDEVIYGGGPIRRTFGNAIIGVR